MKLANIDKTNGPSPNRPCTSHAHSRSLLLLDHRLCPRTHGYTHSHTLDVVRQPEEYPTGETILRVLAISTSDITGSKTFRPRIFLQLSLVHYTLFLHHDQHFTFGLETGITGLCSSLFVDAARPVPFPAAGGRHRHCWELRGVKTRICQRDQSWQCTGERGHSDQAGTEGVYEPDGDAAGEC